MVRRMVPIFVVLAWLASVGSVQAQTLFSFTYSCPDAKKITFGFFQRDDVPRLVEELQTFDPTIEVSTNGVEHSVSYRLTSTRQRLVRGLARAEAMKRRLEQLGFTVSDIQIAGGANANGGDNSPPREPQRTYVAYYCPNWVETNRMDADNVAELAAKLQRWGAEVRTIGAGVGVDDPVYPTKAIRFVKLRYRLVSPQEQVLTDPAQVTSFTNELRQFGFQVKVSETAIDTTSWVSSDRDPRSVATETKPILAARSEWTGTITQENMGLPARLSLVRSGNDLDGELAFRFGAKNYRAKVRGTIRGQTIALTSYEAVEGRVWIPVEYNGELDGTRFTGIWTYRLQRLEDTFAFALSSK